MSWNNQGGGPWGGGGNNQGPWGQGPKRPNGNGGNGGGGGGPTPPDLEDMLRKSQENMKKFMPGGFGSGKLLFSLLWLSLTDHASHTTSNRLLLGD